MLVIDDHLIKEGVEKFIWSFKVADNIEFNLDTVMILYSAKLQDGRNIQVWNKLLIIIETSIIEAVLHDFIIRLTQSTDHFPPILSKTREEIKSSIVPRNYTFKTLLELIKEFKLLGSDEKIYDDLFTLGKLRNRVHIYNWYQNFEKNERIVYTEERLESSERLLNIIVDYMVVNYSRPWHEL